LRILVLVMPGPPHEIASRHFEAILNIKLHDMKCFEDIVLIGSMTQSMPTVRKEPDGSWGSARNDWPTCVLESGVSESSRSLHRDAKIWLDNKESHVTQVVTIKIHRTQPKIVFNVWKKTEEETATRNHADLDQPEQEVNVTLIRERPMTDGILCVSFEDLFERQRRPGTREGDIVFSKRDLGGIARLVWQRMGFVPRQ
jgi:hypothetical protein